jgi:Tol biopolymer transport system component
MVQWQKPGAAGLTDRPTTFVDATKLKASISTSDIDTAGTATVAVNRPGQSAGNNSSNLVPFTICPASGCTGASSTLTRRISSSSSTDNYSPAISATGRYVAFVSVMADPATDASTGLKKVFLRDTCDGASADCVPQTALVSVGVDGAEPNGSSGSPAISADGRLVTFASEATNLVADDTNGVIDVFVRDTCTGAPAGCMPSTTRVSVDSAGAQANGASDTPSISADGRFVAFNSTAGNLVADGSSAPSGAFVRDTCFGADGCKPATTRLAISGSPSP